MIDESMDTQILSQEQGTIEALAHDTRTAVAKVQEIFLTEYRKLAANARIRSYLPLLTSNIVRVILGAKWKTHPNLETSPLGANGAEPFRGRLTSTRR